MRAIVLILVVMEEGQRQPPLKPREWQWVLILVVMEEGQRPSMIISRMEQMKAVLILVVMEEGQRQDNESMTFEVMAS